MRPLSTLARPLGLGSRFYLKKAPLDRHILFSR